MIEDAATTESRQSMSTKGQFKPSNWFAEKSVTELREEQCTDSGLELVIGWIEKGEKPFFKNLKNLHPSARALYPQWKNL